MDDLIKAIASRQPRGVDILVHPSVVSRSQINVDLSYENAGWFVQKHYHVTVDDAVSIVLESFQIRRV